MIFVGCPWVPFIRLRKCPWIPKLLSVFHQERVVLLSHKNAAVLFFFFPFFFPVFDFFSELGHRNGIRKEEALGCCASTPWTAPWASICHLLPPVCISDPVLPLLFWLKLHPSHFDLLCWSTVSWFWLPGFLPLLFNPFVPFLPLSRCPRLPWQLPVFGKLKAVFQAVVSFSLLYLVWFHEYFVRTILSQALCLFNHDDTHDNLKVLFSVRPILQKRKQRLLVANLSEVIYIVSGRIRVWLHICSCEVKEKDRHTVLLK